MNQINPLKEHRKNINFSQQDIAQLLGVSLTTYARWESGKSEPNEVNKSNIQKLLKGQWEGLT